MFKSVLQLGNAVLVLEEVEETNRLGITDQVHPIHASVTTDRVIDLKGKSLTSADCKVVSSLLQGSSGLRGVSVAFARISPSCMVDLVQSVLGYVEVLDLSYMDVTDSVVMALTRGLAQLGSTSGPADGRRHAWVPLETLIMAGNGLNETNIGQLAEALAINTTITRLDLSGVFLGGRGLRVLVSALHNNSTIRELLLNSCAISTSDLDTLCEFVKSPNSRIESLSMANNSFDVNALKILHMHLLDSGVVKELNLQASVRDGAALAPLPRSFNVARRPICRMRRLILCRNHLTCQDVWWLAKSLFRMPDLAELDLSYNKMGCKGLSSLMQALIFSKVKVLSLTGNIIDSAASRVMAFAMMHNFQLEELELKETFISEAGLAHLLAGLLNNSMLSLKRLTGPSLHNAVKTLGFADFLPTDGADNGTILEWLKSDLAALRSMVDNIAKSRLVEDSPIAELLMALRALSLPTCVSHVPYDKSELRELMEAFEVGVDLGAAMNLSCEDAAQETTMMMSSGTPAGTLQLLPRIKQEIRIMVNSAQQVEALKVLRRTWYECLYSGMGGWMTRRVLVVDDSRVVRKFLGRIVRKQHYDVDVADSGTMALQMMKERFYDCVFLDLEMPEMSGLHCAQGFRQWESSANRPRYQIICAHSSHTPAKQQQALSVGINYYQHKPAPVSSVVTMIERGREQLEMRPL